MKYLSLFLILFYAFMTGCVIFGYKPGRVELIAVYIVVTINFSIFYLQERKDRHV